MQETRPDPARMQLATDAPAATLLILLHKEGSLSYSLFFLFFYYRPLTLGLFLLPVLAFSSEILSRAILI